MTHPYYQSRSTNWSSWGYHCTATGDYRGVGDYIRTCREKGVPVSIFSTDSAGIVLEALESGSHPDDCIGFRFTSIPGIGDVDRLPVDSTTDQYAGNPENEFDRLYDIHRQHWPPELLPHIDRIWYTCINEPQTYGEDNTYSEYNSEYLARGFLRIAHRALNDGRRYAAAGWAGGNPHINFWSHPLTLDYLRLAEQHPYQIGINWHLYSLDEYNLLANFGDLVGRYKQLYDVALSHGIAPPFIVAGEAGWGEKAAHAPPSEMIEQMAAVQNQFIADRFLGGLCLWTLGDWGGSIVQDMIDFLPANNNKIRTYKPVTIPEIDGGEPMPETTEKKIYDLSQSWAFPVNEEAALQKAALADGFTPSGAEQWHDVDGKSYAMQPFYEIGNTNNKRSYYAVVGEWGDVMWTDGKDAEIPPIEPSNPLVGLKLGYLFEYQYSDNYSPFNTPRDYDGDGVYDDKHEGLDADVIGGRPDNVVDVLCTYDGVVDRSLDSTGGYGKYIRVQHERNGSIFYTRYCHLDDRFVSVGDYVALGDPVGEVGSTGNVTGEHVHFNLEVPGYGLSGYVVQDVVDPYPYLPSDNMQIPPLPPEGQTVDTLRYFVPTNQYGRKIVMKVGNGTQPMQLEKRANDVILRKGDGNWINNVRYQDSEQWRIVDDEVQKGIDTSDQGNGGRDAYDLHWAQWIPRHVLVGAAYHSAPTVTRFDRTTCQVTTESQANDYLYIKAIIPEWTSPANPGIVLNDVMVVEWRSGTSDLSVLPTETYYFAKEIGYCGWGSHFIVELADGQSPLTGALDCGQ